MKYISLRLGRFEVFILRETVPATFKVTNEGRGEVIVDLPYCSITITNHLKIA